MKKVFLWLVLSVCTLVAWAGNGCEQHRLSREEFKTKQQAYIMEKAGLSAKEAEVFFPVYFELQDRKRALNEEAWTLIRKGREEGVTEKQYEEILEGVLDIRMSVDRLDKVYLDKFKRMLSSRKIYLVQQAEMRFHREVLRGMKGAARKERGALKK